MMIELRPVEQRDLAAVFAIYDQEVLHGIATLDLTPPTASERRRWLEAHSVEASPALVATDPQDLVLGWASASQWSARPGYARTAESSVYVRGDMQRQGVGRGLLRGLIRRCKTAGLRVLLARITVPNPGSVRLHEQLGFATVGVMRGVGEKFGKTVDVRLMELTL